MIAFWSSLALKVPYNYINWNYRGTTSCPKRWTASWWAAVRSSGSPRYRCYRFKLLILTKRTITIRLQYIYFCFISHREINSGILVLNIIFGCTQVFHLKLLTENVVFIGIILIVTQISDVIVQKAAKGHRFSSHTKTPLFESNQKQRQKGV